MSLSFACTWKGLVVPSPSFHLHMQPYITTTLLPPPPLPIPREYRLNSFTVSVQLMPVYFYKHPKAIERQTFFLVCLLVYLCWCIVQPTLQLGITWHIVREIYSFLTWILLLCLQNLLVSSFHFERVNMYLHISASASSWWLSTLRFAWTTSRKQRAFSTFGRMLLLATTSWTVGMEGYVKVGISFPKLAEKCWLYTLSLKKNIAHSPIKGVH